MNETYYNGPIGVGDDLRLVFRQERPEDFAKNEQKKREWMDSLEYPAHIVSTTGMFPIDEEYSFDHGIDGILRQLWEETYPKNPFEEIFREYCRQYFSELNRGERSIAYWWYLRYLMIKNLNPEGSIGIEEVEADIRSAIESIKNPVAAKVLERLISKDSNAITDEYCIVRHQEFEKMTNAGQVSTMVQEIAHSKLLEAAEDYFCDAWKYVMARIQKDLSKEWLIIPFVLINDEIYHSDEEYCSDPQSVVFVRKDKIAEEYFHEPWDDKKHLVQAIRLIESDLDEYVKRLNCEYWYVDLYRGGRYLKDDSFALVGELGDILDGSTPYLPDDFRRLFYAQNYAVTQN